MRYTASEDRALKISIHAPHTGRDPASLQLAGADAISIHAPHTGRDAALSVSLSPHSIFQSTRPIRGATKKRKKSERSAAFQSTRPIGGATSRPYQKQPLVLHFNPRAPYGARQSFCAARRAGSRYFNPRAPYGARLLAIRSVNAPCIFQSTRPIRGATNHRACIGAWIHRFQSTRPIRGATASMCAGI